MGEYQACLDGSCSLFECNADGTAAAGCNAGAYLCPLPSPATGDWHCVDDATALLSGCPGVNGTHLDHTLPIDTRIDILVQRTNLTEQISQLTNGAPAMRRHGIPAYNWLSDDEHGVRGTATTYFPDGPGLGASWDKHLLLAVGSVVGKEARAQHNSYQGGRAGAFNGAGITVYGPNMNLVRDPRWGRAQEVYSEDPRLSAALTVGYVTGIQQGAGAAAGRHDNPRQGDHGNGTTGTVYRQAAACCKHYVAYDIEGNGPLPSRVFQDSQVDTRCFWEHYMPVFDACVNGAGAAHIMCSYNAMNGIPTCADPTLLDGVLRSQWQWPGFVVSDYDAWANVQNTHHYTKDLAHTAAAGLNAGLDQEGGGTSVISSIADAIAQNLTTAARVESAFRRLMRTRITLGMLDPPTLVQYNSFSARDLRSAAATALNRRAAASAVVLLKNGNEGPPIAAATVATAVAEHESEGEGAVKSVVPLLPLELSALIGRAGSVFVTGPLANNSQNMLGNYACDAGNCSTNVTTVLDGLRNAGTGLVGEEVRFFKVPGCSTTNCTSQTGFDTAAAKAASAKVSVLVLGILGWDRQDPGPNASPNAYEREGHDRTSISLAGNQYALAKAISQAQTGTPLVCVLVHGGSIALGSLMQSCDAIVDLWYPGQQGGAGFADVLFGRVSPAGRSPQTWYDSDASLPPLGSMNLYEGNGSTYRFHRGAGTVTVPFGFGLSYSSFAYSGFSTPDSASPCDDISVTVAVRNTGSRVADEVVQLYVKTPNATVPAPQVRLADFTRVQLAPGEQQTVALRVAPKYLAVIRDEGRDNFWAPTIVVESGEVTLHVGGGQPDFAGSAGATLSASVRVETEAKLTTQYRCMHNGKPAPTQAWHADMY
eukprot:g772.t1